MSKVITILIEDTETGQKFGNRWEVFEADTTGVIRAKIGEWLTDHIGKYRYRTSEWLLNDKKSKL